MAFDVVLPLDYKVPDVSLTSLNGGPDVGTHFTGNRHAKWRCSRVRMNLAGYSHYLELTTRDEFVQYFLQHRQQPRTRL